MCHNDLKSKLHLLTAVSGDVSADVIARMNFARKFVKLLPSMFMLRETHFYRGHHDT
ncbi:hypothetical protein SAMN05428964_101548 [Thalassospira xiamenensis]|uniref:Uncharacterized protein n=1 Tax=Thalassospira xiamenensis TaxID=220697 RepID=A0A285RDG9_9PROT|nr:hypothetical protein SAMN05428964_101548 [Thalassospira xiamenensis]